eukprot:XP_001692951.1 predicted protein [Chlamydomonas reinhardtii]
MLTTPGLHPVNCPGGSFLNSWRLVVSNATSGSSSTGEQGRTFHLEFACLRVPAAAQCSRGTDRYYKAGPGRTAAQYRTTDFRALLDFNPDVGTVGRGYLQPLTGFRVFLDSSGRISAEWWGCELPDSFTPARVYAYRTSPRRPDATTGGVAELALHPAACEDNEAMTGWFLNHYTWENPATIDMAAQCYTLAPPEPIAPLGLGLPGLYANSTSGDFTPIPPSVSSSGGAAATVTGFVFVTSSASSIAAGALVPVCAEGVGTAALPLQLCAGLGFSRGSVLSWRRNWDGGSLPPPVVLHNVSCSSGGAAGSGGSAGVGLLAADAAEAACVAVPAYDGYCFEVARVTCSGLHPVNCPGGSFLNSWRLVASNATSGSSTGEQGRTFHLEFACLRVPAAAQCSRGTDRYFKADPARNIRYLTTDMRALLDYFPEIGSLSMGPLTGFRVFLDSSRRISAEWWQCELPDSFTPARVYSYRSSARRPNLATVAMSITELALYPAACKNNEAMSGWELNLYDYASPIYMGASCYTLAPPEPLMPLGLGLPGLYANSTSGDFTPIPPSVSRSGGAGATVTGFVFVTSSASSVAAGALVPVCAEGVGTAALPLQLCAGLGFSRGSVLSWQRNWDGGSLPPPVVLHNVSCSSGGAAGSGGSAGVGLAADAAEAACVAVPAYDGYCFEVARVTCSARMRVPSGLTTIAAAPAGPNARGRRQSYRRQHLNSADIPTEYRLVNGKTPNEGRLEVSLDGKKWGTVCDDGFGRTSAAVVCRALGLPYAAAVALRKAPYGRGTGSYLLDDVACRGDESSLLQCPFRKPFGTSDCALDHIEDVGVLEQPPPVPSDTAPPAVPAPPAFSPPAGPYPPPAYGHYGYYGGGYQYGGYPAPPYGYHHTPPGYYGYYGDHWGGGYSGPSYAAAQQPSA